MNVSFIYNYDPKKDDWEYRYTNSEITEIPRVGERMIINMPWNRSGSPSEKMIDGVVTSVVHVITHVVATNKEYDVISAVVYVSGDYHNPKVIEANNG